MSLTENPDNWEEFIVCRQKVGVIDSAKGKIERLFGTRVYFNEVSKDGDKEKRWIKVTGGKWDRQNAKTYILGISDPEETKTVQCSADFLDNEILENIEKNTQAVLDRPSQHSVKISGSELAVTLALSALEELTGCVQEDDCIQSESGTRDRSASKRLDERLDKTFGDGGGSYHSYPSSIKRVLLECGTHLDSENDVSEDLLHGTGAEVKSTRKTSSEVIVRTKEDVDPRSHFTAPICVSDTRRGALGKQGVLVVDCESEQNGREDVCIVTEQFPSAAQISPVRAKGRGDSEDSLKEFAKKVGYTDEEIDEGFLYVTLPMKPTDFLDILKMVKEGKQKLGIIDQAEPGANNVSTSREKSPEIVSDGDDDIMIVEDYFDKSVEIEKPVSARSKKGGLSKQEKKKNEQKQASLAKEFQKQQKITKRTSPTSPQENASSTSDTQNSGNRKKKQVSPQSGSASGTKRKSNSDSDQEQTCVMKVWEPNPMASSSDVMMAPRHQRLVQPGADVESSQHSQMSQFNENPTHLDPRMRMPHRHGGIYGQAANFDGSPVMYPGQLQPADKNNLRYVIVDGSNVAMFHGNNKVFSCKGIQIAVDYFLDRGHKVTVFVPEWRKYRNYNDNRIRDQEILEKLEDGGHLVFTPSRKINGKLVASYDDRYILSLAEKEDSVILSNDQYRDLMREKASWKTIVQERLLMYRFVGDHFMPAEDPLGRNGPMLDEFLRKHPTASNQTAPPSVPLYNQQQTNRSWGMMPQPNFPVGHWQTDAHWPRVQGQVQNGIQGQVHFQNAGQGPWQVRGRQPASKLHQKPEKPRRHEDVTEQLLAQLKNVFSDPDQEEKLKMVLDNHYSETDLNRLTNYCMEAIFQ